MMMMMSFEEILKMVEKATLNTKRMYWQDEILDAATKIYMKQMELSNKEIEKEIMRNDKLLEREPCEDAVSRQAVLNTLDKRFDSIPVGQTTEILLLRKDLRELPSVTLYKVESEEENDR